MNAPVAAFASLKLTTALSTMALIVILWIAWPASNALAQAAKPDRCPRPSAGSSVPEPQDVRSENGVLKVDFKYVSSHDAQGHTRYCYIDASGNQSPNLRVHPGDWLILTLTNELQAPTASLEETHADVTKTMMNMSASCGGGTMSPWSTNLHFHGLTVPPTCHQDDVLNTMIGPSAPPFEYRFQIPPDEPPGVYWYHPHVHGFSNAQVLGGASGALIVEGIERANNALAGLPERVLIIRDQDLLNPDAAPSQSSAASQIPVLLDAEGDVLNTGTDGGKPAKDLSLNFVSVPYPDYPPTVLAMKPDERQLFRILNASAITYVGLEILAGGATQSLGVVSIDGVPTNEDGLPKDAIIWQGFLLVPPGGRADFIFTGPKEGTTASLIARSVDTGPAGENVPTRPLATIVSDAAAPEPRSVLPAAPAPAAPATSAWLGDVKPVRERKLYFSEESSDPKDPNSPTVFFITVEGQPRKPYDPQEMMPNLTVHQGDVEDWIIENRSRELHAFHIHQLHFILKGYNGVPIEEPFLRDTVNVPYWDGASPVYPSVRLRMDFRDPNTVGTFVYHCHLLEHEDGGMMGTIQVLPASPRASHSK